MQITADIKEKLKGVFENFGRQKSDEDIFYDLVFCICAPMTTFKQNFEAISNLRYSHYYETDLKPENVESCVYSTGYYRQKAKRVIAAKAKFKEILQVIKNKGLTDIEKRNWLVKSVGGLGMKTASQFLRNIGNKQLAIIDTHILKFMGESMPTSKKKYLELEEKFVRISAQHGLTPAEMDAVIWQHYSKIPWEQFKY